ncbi:MAG TPA: lysyl oxidase family protein [Thermoanaerobaculia bacterium]|nr:lysyl oxidase family protein [Thermoanaerobaculia bacterium]
MTKRLFVLLALGVSIALVLVVPATTHAGDTPTSLPDLIVDQKVLHQHWVVRDERFSADLCSVVEGGVTPGQHPVVRFTVSTPNIGNADLALGDPNDHIAANDGLYEFAICHNHYHFRHYALYELVNPTTGFVWRAAKRGFCMIDIEKYNDYPGANNNPYHYRSCGAVGIPGNQGISAGWADVYVWQLGGQYFVLDGGDGQPVVPPGDYIIRITVNPGFVPGPGEPCRFADPLHPGVCHQLPESNYENNVTEVQITIPDHPGKQGVGPLKDQPEITTEIID